jgi:hypothetical protein
MSTHETIGSSNPSSSSTPIGSSESPLTVDEDNGTSSPLPMDAQIDGQTENEDVEGMGKLKSSMWNHFKKRKIDGVFKAVCNYCSKHLGGDSKNGIRHLHNHYKRCPRRTIKDIRQQILVQEQNKKNSTTSLSPYHFDQDVSRKELANMIILHEYPLSIVEHIGFRSYSASLQLMFKMVTRNTIKRDILSIYNFEKDKSMQQIDKNRSRISITTDMWTSQNKKARVYGCNSTLY